MIAECACLPVGRDCGIPPTLPSPQWGGAEVRGILYPIPGVKLRMNSEKGNIFVKDPDKT